jgi:hypothetical protein
MTPKYGAMQEYIFMCHMCIRWCYECILLYVDELWNVDKQLSKLSIGLCMIWYTSFHLRHNITNEPHTRNQKIKSDRMSVRLFVILLHMLLTPTSL